MFKNPVSVQDTARACEFNYGLGPAMPDTGPAPARMTRSRRKPKSKSKHEAAWISEPEEPTTAERLYSLPGQYKVLSDLLVANPKSRSGYSQIDHVVIGPRGSSSSRPVT